MVPVGRDDSGSMFDPRRRPPPNYFSRSVQLKILVMVFLFMGVLLMMSEARKPKNWRWMWQLNGKSAEQETAPGDAVGGGSDESGTSSTTSAAPLDTRPPLQLAQDEPQQEPVVTATDPASAPLSQDGQPQIDSTATAQLDGWNYVLRRLSKDQRKLLQVGMWRWRQRHLPLEEDQGGTTASAATELAWNELAWDGLLKQLDENWADYHTRAYMSVAQNSEQLTDSQRRASVEIIEASKLLWVARKTALEACGQEVATTTEQAEVLGELQQILDQRAWAQVQDNAVLRSAETEAWYRCWDMLQSLSPQQRTQATGPLNFVQLFSQPKELRGRLVKVRGTARWGYRVESREPRFGIEGYIVLGLLPGDESGSPIVVYCTELPADFPKISKADRAGKGVPLDEDIEITGYFFKRWLHRSEGGMNLAPLILGEVTQWQPLAHVGQHAPRRPLTGPTMLLSVLAMALLAGCAALWVYRSSSRSTVDTAELAQAPHELPPFDAADVRGNVAETLREIADDENAR